MALIIPIVMTTNESVSFKIGHIGIFLPRTINHCDLALNKGVFEKKNLLFLSKVL